MQTITCTRRTRIASVSDRLFVVDDTRSGRGLLRRGELHIIVYDVTSRLDPPVGNRNAAFQSVAIDTPRNVVAMPVKSAERTPPVWPEDSSRQPARMENCEEGLRNDDLPSVSPQRVRTLLVTSDVAGPSDMVDSMEVSNYGPSDAKLFVS